MTVAKLTFLGTSSGVPVKTRTVSSVALQWTREGELWLLDCGEGTQHQILLYPEVRLRNLTTICITHMHGDHVLGLPGLLSTLNHKGVVQKLRLLAPRECFAYIEAVTAATHTRMSGLDLTCIPIEHGSEIDLPEFTVRTRRLEHRIPAFGYRITQKTRTGRLDIERLDAEGVSHGPHLRELKHGKDVVLADGRVLKAKDYLGPDKAGKTVVYCTDTTYCQSAIELSRDADLLVHESTYGEAEAKLAVAYKHATARMAATVAHKAGVGQLVLTHFSSRYESRERLEELLVEAREVFPESILAEDGKVVALPY